MINEIKIYRNLVEVDITDFNWTIETLYWEWDVKEFAQKYQSLKAIAFPIHWWRVIDANRIQWFEEAKPDVKNVQNIISSLSKMEQETIRIKVNEYKRQNKAMPWEWWIQNVIKSIQNPYIELENDIKQREISENIRKHKKKLLDKFYSLSKDEQGSLEKQAWEKVFKENPDYLDKECCLPAKWLFIAMKNELIEQLLNK